MKLHSLQPAQAAGPLGQGGQRLIDENADGLHEGRQFAEDGAGGGLVKVDWFRRYEAHQVPIKFDQIVQSCDTASREGVMNDHSAWVAALECASVA